MSDNDPPSHSTRRLRLRRGPTDGRLVMDDLAVAFVMRIDGQALTFEAGQRAAEELAEEILRAAEDRDLYAPREGAA